MNREALILSAMFWRARGLAGRFADSSDAEAGVPPRENTLFFGTIPQHLSLQEDGELFQNW